MATWHLSTVGDRRLVLCGSGDWLGDLRSSACRAVRLPPALPLLARSLAPGRTLCADRRLRRLCVPDPACPGANPARANLGRRARGRHLLHVASAAAASCGRQLRAASVRSHLDRFCAVAASGFSGGAAGISCYQHLGRYHGRIICAAAHWLGAIRRRRWTAASRIGHDRILGRRLLSDRVPFPALSVACVRVACAVTMTENT